MMKLAWGVAVAACLGAGCASPPAGDSGAGGPRYRDADGDGYGDPASEVVGSASPGVDNGDDCDDTDAAVHPGAREVCAGADADCDGPADGADAVDAAWWFDDADGDGYGDDATAVRACWGSPSQLGEGDDCDDTDADVHPGATEVCDGADNDCDGSADGADAVGMSAWYADADGDDHGDEGSVAWACAAPRGYVATPGDCDDTDPDVSPDGSETCNGIDDDCDLAIDEAGASGESRWYPDTDGDGYGARTTSVRACDPPAGYADNAWDCDEDDAAVSPAGTESCNGRDDDCDGNTDEAGSTGEPLWYEDGDGDGDGVPTSTTRACEQPDGYAATDTDCDDADAGRSSLAVERCDSADVDEDCDGLADEADPDVTGSGTWYADLDFDGYGDATAAVTATCPPSDVVADASDCDDTDAAVHPGATESCDAASDLNCDGEVGTGDHDGDGSVACEDCDDTRADVHPGATEAAAGIDDDCDGLIDEYVGDLTLTTLVQIDTFCASYASVEGDLDVDGAPSLGALECLRGVSGDLRVAGVNSPDLEGLEGLTWVGGGAWFGGDIGGATWLDPNSFTSLDGLDRLARVGGDFWVADNEVADLDGAPRLVEVGGGVVLYDLPVVDVSLPMTTLGVGLWLEDLPDLASVSAPVLTEMGGGLWFERVAASSGSFSVDWPVAIPGTLGLVELPAGANVGWVLPDTFGAVWVSETDLVDLAGLEGVTEVSGDLVVSDNPQLADLSAFDDLQRIDGDLTLASNPSLAEWDGFDTVESVGGRVRLTGGGPTDASGFGALTSIGDGLSVTSATVVTVSGFGALHTCGDLELVYLPDLLSAPGLAGARFDGEVTVQQLTVLPDLSFLASTVDLAGSLTVTDNRGLVDTDGLDSLEAVSGAVTFEDNPALAEVSVPALQQIGGALSLVDLDVLAALDLGALESVGGDVALEYLELLPDLSGLGSLRSVGGLWVSQLDSLANLSGLDALQTVEGSLILEYNDDLATLSGLDALESVGTDLRVYANPTLADLAGLDAVESIGRDLTIDTNAALVRPDSLGALTSVGRDLWVESNASLEDLAGLGTFTLGNTLWLADNPSLRSLDGLDALAAVPHHLVLWNLPQLADLAGLAGLRAVGTDFRICACDALVDLTGLEGLESIGESLEIGYQVSWSYGSGNLALTSLDGLESLTTIGDDLAIVENPVLADIDALDGLGSIGRSLYVIDNVSLPTADANDLADGAPTVGGTTTISGNL